MQHKVPPPPGLERGALLDHVALTAHVSRGAVTPCGERVEVKGQQHNVSSQKQTSKPRALVLVCARASAVLTLSDYTHSAFHQEEEGVTNAALTADDGAFVHQHVPEAPDVVRLVRPFTRTGDSAKQHQQIRHKATQSHTHTHTLSHLLKQCRQLGECAVVKAGKEGNSSNNLHKASCGLLLDAGGDSGKGRRDACLVPLRVQNEHVDIISCYNRCRSQAGGGLERGDQWLAMARRNDAVLCVSYLPSLTKASSPRQSYFLSAFIFLVAPSLVESTRCVVRLPLATTNSSRLALQRNSVGACGTSVRPDKPSNLHQYCHHSRAVPPLRDDYIPLLKRPALELCRQLLCTMPMNTT